MIAPPHSSTVRLLVIGAGLGLGCGVVIHLLGPKSPVKIQSPKEPIQVSSPLQQTPPSPPASLLASSLADGPREFRPSQPGDAVEIAKLEREFWDAQDDDTRFQVLEKLETSLFAAPILPFLNRILSSDEKRISSMIRERALELLSGNISPDILPLLESALKLDDPLFRAKVVLATANVHDSKTVTFLENAFSDSSSMVRLSVFDALENQTDQSRQRILSKAITSYQEDVALHALGELQVDANHNSVLLLIQALDAPLAEVRTEANQALEFFFGQQFPNSQEALKWWRGNQKNYDKNLIEKSSP